MDWVLGWGVGGIEAEAVMLGQPIYMLMPEVIGFELTNALTEGATATDLVLTVTQMLRKEEWSGSLSNSTGMVWMNYHCQIEPPSQVWRRVWCDH